LKAVDDYAPIAEDVLHHHERYDGKGYPKGLKGEEIPLISRIITVADAWEAMTSERPYKEAKTRKEAITELKKCSGKQFDPEITEVFIKLIEERGY
jgi:HD-GYP domain-containing protein (c-di-GMP phosphodiesterase class II)